MPESLKSKAANSVMWSAVERFSVQGIQFILTIIIARLVSPSDYGLIAMLGIFLAIAQTFIDSGFSNALIQKQDRTETDFSTVFYFNIVVGVVVYLLLYLCSPFIASFYNEPKLDLVTKVVGLNLIISSFSVVQRAKLTIALNFKLQAVASLIAVIISGVVGVYMAYVGYGVWAIAVQALLNNFLNTLLLWILTKWMPGICFSWVSFKGLFGFGSKLLLSALLHTIYTNLYSIVIGKKFSATDLGYYNRAYTVAYFPSNNISGIITRAIYPIQCSIQDDDERLRNSFLQYLRMSAYIIFPLMIGLCVLAKPFVLLVLTDKWLPMVPLLQIMCIAYMWDPIMAINHNIVTVRGHSDYFLKAEIIKKVIAVFILITTIPFGLKIMCIGLVLYAFCDIFIMSIYSYKVIQITFLSQMRSIFPIVCLNIFTGLSTSIFVKLFLPSWSKFVLGVLFACFLYVGLSYIFKIRELQFIRLILLNIRIRKK